MTIIDAYEAKTHFSQLLERVARENASSLPATMSPSPIWSPSHHPPFSRPKDAIADINDIKTLRQRYRLEGHSMKAIEEGRL